MAFFDLDLEGQLKSLREALESGVIGQPDAIDVIMGVLERYQAGLHDGKRPIGSFLFLGPTGVGKTHTVQRLAELIQPEDAFIKIDCSEYQLEHEVAKLLGSPPGYVGHEAGSHLTRQLAAVQNPDRGFILLLDEVEKANPRFFDSWLQVMDSGYMTDSKGRKLDFTKAIIFLTSNVGASNYSNTPEIGFRSIKGSIGNIESAVTSELKKTFRPEFLNRLSATVFFRPLTKEQQALIFDNMLKELNQRLARHFIRITLSPAFRDLISQKGFSHEYGARELKRTMIKELEQPLAKYLINKTIPDDAEVLVDLYEGKPTFKVTGNFPILQEETNS